MSGEWTWIRDSEGDRSRFEIDSPEGLIVMIDTPEQSLLCADGACFDTAEAMGGVMPNIGDMFTEGINNVESEAATANVEQVDGREIAGTDTEFKINTPLHARQLRGAFPRHEPRRLVRQRRASTRRRRASGGHDVVPGLLAASNCSPTRGDPTLARL